MAALLVGGANSFVGGADSFVGGFEGAGGSVTLTGANCTQNNTSSTGAISQVHILTGANASIANTSSTGAISVETLLTGNNCTLNNTSTTGAIVQTHVLTGANCTQANSCTTGAISLEVLLTGNNCVQSNTSSTGSISQIHVLAGANGTQQNTCTSGAISGATEAYKSSGGPPKRKHFDPVFNYGKQNKPLDSVLIKHDDLVKTSRLKNIKAKPRVAAVQLIANNCILRNICTAGTISTHIKLHSGLMVSESFIRRNRVGLIRTNSVNH